MDNNAGIEEKHPFLEMPFARWRKIITVNRTGLWLCSQIAAQQMVTQGSGGRIINISSVHEDMTMPTNAPYRAAKGGLRMLMRTIAVELSPHQITVNNIGPGAIDTPMDAPLKAHPDQMKTLLSETRLGGMGLRIENMVRNEGWREEGHMILFHMNPGFPLLDDGARLLVDPRDVHPCDDEARTGLEVYNRFVAPREGFSEQVFVLDLRPDADGYTTASCVEERRYDIAVDVLAGRSAWGGQA